MEQLFVIFRSKPQTVLLLNYYDSMKRMCKFANKPNTQEYNTRILYYFAVKYHDNILITSVSLVDLIEYDAFTTQSVFLV